MPYINENGILCIVAIVYSPAGAGYYRTLLNTVTKETVSRPRCTADHNIG